MILKFKTGWAKVTPLILEFKDVALKYLKVKEVTEARIKGTSDNIPIEKLTDDELISLAKSVAKMAKDI